MVHQMVQEGVLCYDKTHWFYSEVTWATIASTVLDVSAMNI